MDDNSKVDNSAVMVNKPSWGERETMYIERPLAVEGYVWTDRKMWYRGWRKTSPSSLRRYTFLGVRCEIDKDEDRWSLRANGKVIAIMVDREYLITNYEALVERYY